MSTSNVPSLQILSTGVSLPQSSDILNGVQSDLNNAFGGNLNVTTVGTPQGYLAENITYYLSNENALIAYMMTQFDPQTAEGRWQDAIARLYFLTRKSPTPTTVTCELIGQPTTTVLDCQTKMDRLLPATTVLHSTQVVLPLTLVAQQ